MVEEAWSLDYSGQVYLFTVSTASAGCTACSVRDERAGAVITKRLAHHSASAGRHEKARASFEYAARGAAHAAPRVDGDVARRSAMSTLHCALRRHRSVRLLRSLMARNRKWALCASSCAFRTSRLFRELRLAMTRFLRQRGSLAFQTSRCKINTLPAVE